MRRLSVFVEINGESVYVGEIAGKDSTDACFTYADTYLENQEHRAISIGLPLEEKSFDAIRTRIFFEGLLPEGFTRRCVAEWMHMEKLVSTMMKKRKNGICQLVKHQARIL